jgi:hypothetical protein
LDAGFVNHAVPTCDFQLHALGDLRRLTSKRLMVIAIVVMSVSLSDAALWWPFETVNAQSKFVVGAVAPGIADIVAQADAVGRAVVLAQVANLAITRIDDDRLGSCGIHTDDIGRTGEDAQTAARAGIEIDRQLAVNGIGHE